MAGCLNWICRLQIVEQFAVPSRAAPPGRRVFRNAMSFRCPPHHAATSPPRSPTTEAKFEDRQWSWREDMRLAFPRGFKTMRA